MSKTLMSYPRPSYVLALFYILISALLPDISFWILCALQVNRVVFRSFLELQRRRSGKLVATSRRFSVATSRRLVNRRQSHSNITTSQRHDILMLEFAMSRRPHDFCFRIIKSTGDLILEKIEERMDVVRKTKQ